jgi:threonine dehydrogenase-like Zn-dependent dehydrogenase
MSRWEGLTLRTGQTHVRRYLQPLLQVVEARKFNPSFVITHRLRLDEAPRGYQAFRDKEDGCIKVVLTP